MAHSNAPANETSVPYAASDNAGWKGVSLRRVSDGVFVLSKPRTSEGDAMETVTFTQTELAPYVGIACTLELINSDRGGWGWLSMDNVVIPGDTAPPGEGAAILSFTIAPYGAATIVDTNITMVLPFGTDLTSLTPDILVSSNATCSPASGVAQNFTAPVIYTVVSASLANTNEYTVTLTVAPEGPTLINVNYYGGTIPGNAYMNGIYTDNATARGSASRVAPSAYGGSTWNDFNNSGATSSDLLSSTGASTGVGLTTTMQGGPWNDWNGLGNNRMLVSGVIAHYTSYTPVFTLTGLNPSNKYDIYIASLHSSNNRPVDFMVGAVTKHVQYAAATDWGDGTNYALLAGVIPDPGGQVVVSAQSPSDYFPINGFQIQDMGPRGLNSDATIYSFDFPGYGAATINGTNINIALPVGTDVTALSPTYVASAGATVDKASGSTWDFSVPVFYTVVSEDTTATNEYMATVTLLSIVSAALDISATGTGLDIQNDGILVAANHFGGVGDGMLASAPVTLTNGLTFGISTNDMVSGWPPVHSTSSDAHGHVPLITDPDFGTLMRAYFWCAGGQTPHMAISGLTPGNTYRLQLISTDPQNCTVSVEGSASTTWTNVPSVLTAIWAAKDDTANVILNRTAGEIDFNAYVLHDISSLTPYVDITNIDGTTNVPIGTTVFNVVGTNSDATVGDIWWTNALEGGCGVVPADSTTGWSFNIALASGDNVVTVSGSNATGTVRSDSATVTVVPEPAAAVAAVAVWCCLLAARKRAVA